MSIFITSDSTCDLNEEQLKRFGVCKLVPLSVYLGDEEHKDGVDIAVDDLYSFFEKTKSTPKTAAVVPAEYEDMFSSLLGNADDEIVHISFSSKLSSCYQNALIAAEGFEGRVKVVDSKSLFGGQALLVIKAAELRDSGKTSDEIVKEIEQKREKLRVTFVINKLDFLSKGGRCSSVAALGANLLGIKPVIEMTDGALSMSKKIRGKLEAVHGQYIEELFSEAAPDTDETIVVGDTGIDGDYMDKMADKVKKLAGSRNIMLLKAGCTISSHAGPQTFSVIYFKK